MAAVADCIAVAAGATPHDCSNPLPPSGADHPADLGLRGTLGACPDWKGWWQRSSLVGGGNPLPQGEPHTPLPHRSRGPHWCNTRCPPEVALRVPRNSCLRHSLARSLQREHCFGISDIRSPMWIYYLCNFHIWLCPCFIALPPIHGKTWVLKISGFFIQILCADWYSKSYYIPKDLVLAFTIDCLFWNPAKKRSDISIRETADAVKFSYVHKKIRLFCMIIAGFYPI